MKDNEKSNPQKISNQKTIDDLKTSLDQLIIDVSDNLVDLLKEVDTSISNDETRNEAKSTIQEINHQFQKMPIKSSEVNLSPKNKLKNYEEE
jgi:hypothetical protein